MMQQHSHVVVAQRGPGLKRWMLESILEFLDDRTMGEAMAVCTRWHVTATLGPWARGYWSQQQGLGLHDNKCACCPRGAFLMYVAPERQMERWQRERDSIVTALTRERRRLRVVVILTLTLAQVLLPSREALYLVLWPIQLVWDFSKVARLAHSPLLGETDWPLAHALASPDTLELRHYAFITSATCVVVGCVLTQIWWRIVWYALGTITFDVADLELKLKKLDKRKVRRAEWKRARKIVELNRPALRVVLCGILFVLVTAGIVVARAQKPTRVYSRALLILVAALRRDVLPVFMSLSKLAFNLFFHPFLFFSLLFLLIFSSPPPTQTTHRPPTALL